MMRFNDKFDPKKANIGKTFMMFSSEEASSRISTSLFGHHPDVD